MIQFSFETPSPESPWWQKTWDSVYRTEPATIDEMSLRYKYFGVRPRLVVDGVAVMSGESHVPLVDLALSLRFALHRLSSGEDAAIGFTESDRVIHLQQEERVIAITSSDSEWRTTVDSEALKASFVTFVREAHSRLIAHCPELACNASIQKLREIA
ncbi:hypothetical protein [Streptomyces sp. NPDC046939]|uniref:hypothetical protein n=1 Tax=Streptomyces sp. NPDC046939 TaxID=3155376 RepID=UPI0033EE1295